MYERQETSFDLYSDQKEWLAEMTTKFALPDESKTLRILLEFARTEADLEIVFNDIRCTRC